MLKNTWVAFVRSFILALLLNSIVITVVDALQYHGQLANSYMAMCLPLQVGIMAVTALAGALLAKAVRNVPWTGAIISVWIGTVPSVAIAVWALLTIGPGP